MAPSSPITAVIVGAGHRAVGYASYAMHHPEELSIVGVADPNPLRQRQATAMFGLPVERCFDSSEALAAQPRFADLAINGTMDHQHVATSLPLLRAGYHMLLEKPFATNMAEMWRLADAARRHERTVMICHVLRYAPFYLRIRELVAAGEIGEVYNIQTTEHVSYHHMVVGYVRGKWNNRARCHSTMLMAKCCHDLDIIAWMKSDVRPTRIASFGSNVQFRPERRPPQAGTRCLVDCPIEAQCPYSARKHYLDHPHRWSFYVWDSLEHIANPTLEDKERSLKTDNPYGRCVWRCDNDVVDHQSLVIEFADGCTATHNMVGATSRPSRSLHLIGTGGEIQGVFEDSRFVIRHFDQRPGHEYTDEVVDLNQTGDMHGAFGGHGGGDLNLVADCVRTIRGDTPSIACTSLQDSISGHLMGFCADLANDEGRVVELPWPDRVGV